MRIITALNLLLFFTFLVISCDTGDGDANTDEEIKTTDTSSGDLTENDDAGDNTDGMTLNPDGPFTMIVDVTFPEGAVPAGFRPVVAVYDAAKYNDFTQKLPGSPKAAIMGAELDPAISGVVTDLFATKTYEFDPGKYSVVFGVSPATGFPIPEGGMAFIGVAVDTAFEDSNEIQIKIEANDPSWTTYQSD